MQKLIPLILFSFVFNFVLPAQKVGLVLSGGGADALAHIGVIKALEENNIKIDYITGTSMGALIGALYAGGIPIATIEKFFTSNEFRIGSTGVLLEKFQYYYPKPSPTPIIIPIRFKKTDEGFTPLFPDRVIPSEQLDINIVKMLAQIEKEANYNFDSLHIPFRCVAADLVTKKLKVFSSGSLTQAIRASMSYPFYIRPIEVDGHLMYDGGVYNNFPADIMCQDFQPDFIIGSNVSKNAPNPTDDDLLGQLQSILMQPTNYSIDCGEGELIEPNINIGTFRFERAQIAIDSGYAAAMRQIAHIKYHVPTYHPISNEISPRTKTNDTIKIGEIIFEGLNEKQAKYAGSVLRRIRKKDTYLGIDNFERNYFRLYQESYIEDVYPLLKYNTTTKKYDAIIRVNPIKSLTLNLGGNVASRPISQGYVGLTYNNLSTFGFKTGASMHYGRLYQAGHIFARFDFPTRLPLYIKPKFTIHNWNWFESRQANLFVTNKPNYVIEGELFTGFEMGVGLGNIFKLTGEISYLQQESKYYQTKNFSPADTADATRFNGLITKLTLSSNTLNQIQYPYRGRKINIQAAYITGNEFYTPGSTTPSDDKVRNSHNYIQLKFDFQNYVSLSTKFKLGFNVSGAYSGMGFFSNYTSTVIQAPYFKPTPDSRTLFLESFHASKYGAVGVQLVLLPYKKIQIRAEGYIFQPYQAFILQSDGQVSYGTPLADRFAIVSGVIVYQTLFGPLSFSINYYYNNPDISPEDEAPVTALLNFGYILFNDRAYH